MAETTGSVTIKVNVPIDNVVNATKTMTSEFQKMDRAVGGNAEREFKQLSTAINDTINKLRSNTSAMESNNAKLKAQTSTVKNLTKEYGENSAEVKHAKAEYGNLQFEQSKLVKENKNLSSSLDSQKEALTSVNVKYKNLETAANSLGNKTTANVSKLSALKTQLSQNAIELAQQKNRIAELTAKYGENSNELIKAKAKFAELESQETQLTAESGRLAKSVGNITPQMAKAQDKAKAMASTLQNIGSKMSSVGNKMTLGITTPVVTGLGLAGKAAVDFDSQIQSMGSLLDAKGSQLQSQLANLGNASKKWATQYGVSTSSINDGMSELIKKGYSYNQVLGAMPSILNATRASGDDFNDVMKVSTSTLEQFGLKSNNTQTMLKNTQRVTDGLSFVANKTSAGFQDMGYAMEYVGPVANGLKMPLEQTAAAIGLMSNQGIEGQKAGTALRGALSQLMNPTKQNTVAFEKMGISIKAFKDGTLDFPTILDKIKTNTADWTAQEKQAVIAQAFGTEAQSGMNILINEGGDALRNLTKETQGATGYTKKLSDTMNNTSKANIDKLKQSLNVLAINMGTELVPMITKGVKWITNLVKSFGEMDKGTQKMILTTLALAAAGGPALSMFGKMTSTAGTLVKIGGVLTPTLASAGGAAATAGAGATAGATGLGAMATAAGTALIPIAGIALGIAAVGTAAYFGIKAYNAHEAAVKQTNKTISEFGVNVDQTTVKTMKDFNDLHKSAQNDMLQLDNATEEQSKKLTTDIVSKYDQMTDQVVTKVKEAGKKGQAALKDIGSGFGTVGNQWVKDVGDNINGGVADHTEKLKQAKQTIEDIARQTGGDLSQMTSAQRKQFEQAQAYIEKQATSFVKNKDDQQALLKEYSDDRYNVSASELNKELTQSDKYYSQAESKSKKHYNKLKADLKDTYTHTDMTRQQYNEAMNILEAKRNTDSAKNEIELQRTRQSGLKNFKNTGEQIIETGTTLQSSYNGILGMYKSTVTGKFETRQQWIKEAKELNKTYIKNETKDHDSIGEELKKYQKSQVKAYESMGLSRKEAVLQAKLDTESLKAENNKAASSAKKSAEDIHASYVQGLKSGNVDTGTVAKSWGLDLTNATKNIDLGKYGKKTAQQFWNDIQSGSKKGYEEAKFYFTNQMQDWKKSNDDSIAKIGDSGKAKLSQALAAGVVTIKQAKTQFGNSIYDLFPNDLSQVSDGEIKSLSDGLQKGVLSLNTLKGKFGEQVYQLFPSDLSKLSAEEIKTIRDGYKNESISSADLQKKFAAENQTLFQTDLANLGQKNIQKLKDGMDAGIVTLDEVKQAYQNKLNDVLSKDLSGIGTEDVKTLQNGMKLGILNQNDVNQAFQQSLDGVFKKNMSEYGNSDIRTLAEGMKLGIPEASNAMQSIASSIKKGATVDVSGEGRLTMQGLIDAYNGGKIGVSDFTDAIRRLLHSGLSVDTTADGNFTGSTFSAGILAQKANAAGSGKQLADASTTSLDTGNEPWNKGNATGANYNGGLASWAQGISLTAANLSGGVLANFDIKDAAGLKGSDASSAYGGGIYANAGIPMQASADTANGVTGNFETTVENSDKVSSALGSSKHTSVMFKKPSTKLPHNKRGTNGPIITPTPSIVGDGGKPELIAWGNGALGLSPAVPTLTHLDAGAQVFSGEQTEQVMPILKSFGVPMFAKGTGGNVIDWVKNLFGDVFKFLEHPIDNWKKMVESSFDMKPFASGSANGAMGDGAKVFAKNQTDWLKKIQDSMSAPAGSGVERWRPQVLMALKMLGLSESLVGKVLKQIQTESGGNEKAMGGNDGLADGNAMGLMQVKPPTFRSYMVSGHGNIWNGFDNLLAGLNYAKSRYGSDLSFLGQGHGYAYGGHIMAPTMGIVGEVPGQDEFIINPWKSNAAGLTSQLLSRINDVQPGALNSIQLPGFNMDPSQAVTAELASGFHVAPSTPVTTSTSVSNQSSTDGSSDLLNLLNKLVENLTTGDIVIENTLDGDTLSRGILSKLDTLMANKTKLEMSRGGLI